MVLKILGTDKVDAIPDFSSATRGSQEVNLPSINENEGQLSAIEDRHRQSPPLDGNEAAHAEIILEDPLPESNEVQNQEQENFSIVSSDSTSFLENSMLSRSGSTDFNDNAEVTEPGSTEDSLPEMPERESHENVVNRPGSKAKKLSQFIPRNERIL